MKTKNLLLILLGTGVLTVWGCDRSKPGPANSGAPTEVAHTSGPSALPDSAFKATLSIADAPAKLRAGEKQVIQIKVKNASDVLWYARGAAVNNSSDNKFYLAVGDRWLEADGQKLVTDMDGRYGLNKDLKPGEETEVPLAITAPKVAGEYVLEIDLIQEQVAWFHDKGSPTARLKITVER